MTWVPSARGATPGRPPWPAPAAEPGSRSARAKAAPSAKRSVGRLGQRAAYDSARGRRAPSPGRSGTGLRRWAMAVATGAVGDEGLAAGQALEGDDAEGVDVGGGGRGAALGLLGRDVGGRAHHLAGLGEGHPLRGAGDAEVGDLDPAVGGDEEVGGLDVAVDDAGGVRDAEGLGGLGEQVAGHVGVERGARAAGARRAAGPRRAPSRGRGAAWTSRRRASSRRSRRPTRCRGAAARPRAGPRSRSAAGRAGRRRTRS